MEPACQHQRPHAASQQGGLRPGPHHGHRAGQRHGGYVDERPVPGHLPGHAQNRLLCPGRRLYGREQQLSRDRPHLRGRRSYVLCRLKQRERQRRLRRRRRLGRLGRLYPRPARLQRQHPAHQHQGDWQKLARGRRGKHRDHHRRSQAHPRLPRGRLGCHPGRRRQKQQGQILCRLHGSAFHRRVLSFA